ncbi:MAG: Na/Pi symporter [Pirellulaceae bacterium]|nr:Na/Pi symporter [Pirellulaceae bacterium]
MNGGILEVLGGVGLFLLGMTVMTEGLNRLAGESLRSTLSTFTKTPFTGIVTGTIVTALIQSSSATTVMAVGFVGAGLLTFLQALGIILGANIGTTATGWIVALWGFTLSLKNVALPMLFVGAMLRLSRRKRIAAIGYAIAGFGAVFIGIAMLQSGMEVYKDAFTPESFPTDTILGRLLLLLIGLGVTLVTQSSSAGVAMAVTAVHVGNISLSQAAAMVIGMDIGTTVAALLASLGGNVNARRTGLSHVIYNVITGTGAFICLPLYIRGLVAFAPTIPRANPELALVAFHSLFNVLGVILVFPFIRQFAALIVRIAPADENKLTERLEPSLLRQPQVAIENVLVTLREISRVVFSSLAGLLSSSENRKPDWTRMEEAAHAIEETRSYLNRINDPIAVESGFRQKITALHILDHLDRLIERIQKHGRLEAAVAEPDLSSFMSQLTRSLNCDLADASVIGEAGRELRKISMEIDLQSDRYRNEAIERTVKGKVKIEALITQLDAIRWLQRVTYHSVRIVHYLTPSSSSVALPHEEEPNLDLV